MGSNHNEQGFLSSNFPRSPPKLYITAESDDFDELTLREWRDEGFNVEYLPLGASSAEYKAELASLKTQANLGPCETYGIIAYGDAASICLEYFHVMDNNPEFKLCCLVAYYPTQIPDTRAQFPSAVSVLAHLAGKEVGVVSHSQLVGIQGKRRVTKRPVERGLGSGGLNKMAYPSYTYDAEPGFAEHDLDEYHKISAELAWSRSLAAVRRAFRMDVDPEMVLEQNVEGKFYARQLGQTMSTYTTRKSPHVTYFPTLTGGIGAGELRRFYSEYFLSSNPPSTKLTLLSRTVGGDRVVDELHVAFKHTQEMPWILPGVPPTNKRVEVIVVSIVTLRGGKLYHEHVYWDQASVLVQTGLLDPKLVPDKAKERGVKKLPVVGREGARRLIRGFDDEEDGEADNELLPGWYDDDEPGPQESRGNQSRDAGDKKAEDSPEKEPENTRELKESNEPSEPQVPTQPLNGDDKSDEKNDEKNDKQEEHTEETNGTAPSEFSPNDS
ncbi:dienelactone hydrolase [Xylariaceae sp. FL1651]|nr:dienelactone hydrolase [Xylariaceae sp. FL1651]